MSALRVVGEPGPAVVPQAVPGSVAIKRIIDVYDHAIVRGYAWGRFKIFRQRFLDEIGQYLPDSGRVLDVGCGFGLFSLYYAQLHPRIELQGFDLSETRIRMARDAADKLGLSNAAFRVGDAAQLRVEDHFDAVYMLDVVHHVPKDTVRPLLTELHRALPRGGRLIIKDLDTEPAWQRLFAHALDLAMSPTSPVHYWNDEDLRALLVDIGFDVKLHAMVDYLPYPHVLFVATRR